MNCPKPVSARASSAIQRTPRLASGGRRYTPPRRARRVAAAIRGRTSWMRCARFLRLGFGGQLPDDSALAIAVLFAFQPVVDRSQRDVRRDEFRRLRNNFFERHSRTLHPILGHIKQCDLVPRRKIPGVNLKAAVEKGSRAVRLEVPYRDESQLKERGEAVGIECKLLLECRSRVFMIT